MSASVDLDLTKQLSKLTVELSFCTKCQLLGVPGGFLKAVVSLMLPKMSVPLYVAHTGADGSVVAGITIA